MGQKKTSKKKPIDLIEIPQVDVGPLGHPIDATIRIGLGGHAQAFVFTVSQSTRARMSDDQFVRMGQALGDRVHPHQATVIVLPDGTPDLRAYRVVQR